MSQTSPNPQHTVRVRVQVVDMQPRTLDLEVPTYLAARDLTQRIARDAGLISHWDDGRRRLYWLRARGRLLRDEEDLGDLGVVPGELVYLLPEPPVGSTVLEQKPEYPSTRGYAARGIPALLVSILGVLLWSLGWGVALSIDRGVLVIVLPGLGLGLLCTSLGRHLWGGQGNRTRVVLTGLILFLIITALAFAFPALFTGEDLGVVFKESVPGFVAGLAGVLFAWLAWWGPVEPLPAAQDEASTNQESQAVATVPCAICGQPVTPDVRQECPHHCGRYFHVGCYNARLAVYRGDGKRCALCDQPLE